MEMLKELPIHFFANAPDWETWLRKHYAQPSGIWLKVAKKTAKTQSVTYDEALDVALCYGWIDGQLQRYDNEYYLQKFTPRRPKSVWSKRNVAKIGALIAAGRLQPPGLQAVEAAKQDGRWQQAYDSPGNMTVSPDFQAALNRDPKAKAFFDSLNKTNRYSFLWRIQTAKTPQARQTQIGHATAMLHAGKVFHPKKGGSKNSA